MAVNYIQGQILAETLERDGIDLSIANANVGIGHAPSARLDVYGNIRAGNVLISNIGTVSAQGNITGGNLIAVNFVGANIATITANLAAGNVLTDHLLYANGTPWDLQEPAGSNTQIQFNNNSQFGATANFTFNTAANLFTVNATANIANLGVQGNVVGGNLLTTGIISTAGNAYASTFVGNVVGNISGNIVAPGSNTQVIFNDNGVAGASAGFTFDKISNSISISNAVVATGNLVSANVNTTGLVSATGNVTGGNVLTGGLITATGNILGGNLITAGQISATSNITGGNVLTSGLISATGNITGAANVTGGNLTTAGQVSATANITGGNVLTGGIVTATGNLVTGANLVAGGYATVTGNITGGNVLTDGLITATGNVTGENLLTSGVISATGNITSGQLTIANTVIVATSANSTITLQPTGTGLVSINTTTGLVIPVGNTAQRPTPGTTGTIRFNTDSTRVEVYDGTEWDTVVAGVTNQILNGDGSTTAFTLDRSTTTAAALIMLNGITQVPGQSYSMVPSPSVNLVFSEAPGTGDLIDIRFL
jgi:hypothetical protein